MTPLRVLFFSCVLLSTTARSEPDVAPQVTYAPLQMEAGTWAAELQFYEDDKPSRKATGTQVNTLLLNGHWIVNDLKIAATDKDPAYQAHGMWGYDAVAKTYVNTWVDTNDQTVRTDYGTWSEADTTMVWSSKQNDGNGHIVDYRIVEEFNGQQRTMTVYQLGLMKPNPQQVLKIVFAKKQSDAPQSSDTPHRQYERPGSGRVP